MGDANFTFPSDEWIPSIVKLCGEFHSLIVNSCPDGHFLKYRNYIGTIEKPGRIVKEYHRTASLLKIEIFGEPTNKDHIDHHKIIALYIRSFLKYQPFLFDVPNPIKYYETNRYTRFPNEYFIIDYMETIFKAANNDINGELLIDPDYEQDFIKLLYEYKNDISKLHPISLAHDIYHIEQRYFISSKPRKVKSSNNK